MFNHWILKLALLEGQISYNEYKYMVQDNLVTPVIYTIPKIHEDLLHPPGRQIVPVNGSLTEPLSQYVDSHLTLVSQRDH